MPAANPQTTSTRLPPSDEAAIRDLVARLKAAWDSGDAEAFGAVFSEGAKYVTATGRRLDGRAAIVESHARDFRTYFKNTHLGEGYPTAIEHVDEHVAIIHGTGAVLFAGESESNVAPNGLITLVAAKRDGRWQFVAFNNTPTRGPWRNMRFAWRYMLSRTLRPFLAEWSKARRHMIAEKKRNIAAWKSVGAWHGDTDAARKLNDHAEHGAGGGRSAQ